MKKIKRSLALFLTLITVIMSLSIAMTAFAASKLSIPSSASYYGGHAYKFYVDRCTWKQAKKRCESRGGHLATITSKSEDEFVYSLAQTNVWLGATDEKKEGTWKWVTGEKFKYKNWAIGQPDNCTEDGETENYLGIWDNSQWNDNKNDAEDIYGYICEWEIGKVRGIEQISTTSSKVVLSWDDQDLATGYEIYYESTKGKYIKYKSTTNASLTISGLSYATEYNMKIRSKYKSSTGKTAYTPFVKFTIATKPGTAKNLKVVDKITLSWTKVKGAERYAIYKYDADSKKWEYIASSLKNSYKLGKKFGSAKEQYKVRAYIKTSTGQNIYGNYSDIVKR